MSFSNSLNISQGAIFLVFADICMEEGELGASLFPLEEARTSILFLHLILRYSPPNHVRAGG